MRVCDIIPISSKAPNCIWYTCTIKGMRRSFLQKHFIIIYGLVQLRIVPASISEDNMNHEPNTTDIHLFPFLASVSLALHQHTRSLRHTPLRLGQSLTKQDVIIFSTAFKLQERGLGMTTCESCFSASHSLQLCQTYKYQTTRWAMKEMFWRIRVKGQTWHDQQTTFPEGKTREVFLLSSNYTTTSCISEFRKLCAKHLRMQLMKLVWSKQSWNLDKEEPWICSACFGHSIIPICVIL